MTWRAKEQKIIAWEEQPAGEGKVGVGRANLALSLSLEALPFILKMLDRVRATLLGGYDAGIGKGSISPHVVPVFMRIQHHHRL